MRTVFCLLSLIGFSLPQTATAQVVFGNPQVIDGDTLDFGGTRVRLFGIDAPESGQSCTRAGEDWACGEAAGNTLKELVAGQQIMCRQRDIDHYGRIVATCMADRLDLADAMATAGLAVALPSFSPDYVARAERARELGAGIWGGEFAMPADFRATDPEFRQREEREQHERQSERTALTVRESERARPANAGVFYRNCREARAAGAAPLYRGQPGYRPEMDGDGDGIACEPVRQ